MTDEIARLLEDLKRRREVLIQQLIAEDNERVRGKIHELNYIIRTLQPE